MDFNPADSAIRQSYKKFELSSAKYLSLKGWTPAYRELMRNLDEYIAEEEKKSMMSMPPSKTLKPKKAKERRTKRKKIKSGKC